MRFLIVDDERPARAELVHSLMQLTPESESIPARNGNEALRLLDENGFDVCFLDIQMPGMNGLELAAQILEDESPPLIVFATAYDAHAIRAFELNVLDYLVKPIKLERLSQVLERIRLRLTEKSELTQNLNALRALLINEHEPKTLNKLVVSGERSATMLIEIDQIAWIEAKDRRVFVHTMLGEKYPITSTLRQLEERLVSYNHMRVHKSFLVNLDAITEIAPMFSGTNVITLRDAPGTKIPVSRKYSSHLKKRIKGY